MALTSKVTSTGELTNADRRGAQSQVSARNLEITRENESITETNKNRAEGEDQDSLIPLLPMSNDAELVSSYDIVLTGTINKAHISYISQADKRAYSEATALFDNQTDEEKQETMAALKEWNKSNPLKRKAALDTLKNG